jgi:hypothetical protein
MTYPAFDTSGLADAAAGPGPVTCTACGCRLERATASGVSAWYHFAPMAGRDARGCKVGCADDAHDGRGRALAVSAA